MPRPLEEFTWTIRCQSPRDLDRALQKLKEQTNPDHVRVVKRSCVTDGSLEYEEIPHRFGDYFDEIEIRELDDPPRSLRLTFQPRREAARYWKDMMVFILGELKESGVVVEFHARIPVDG